MERRHPGHRVDLHAGRADLRPRAGDGYALARGGLQGETRTPLRLRLGAQPQLGRQGGAARRLRPRQRAARPVRRRVRDARRRAGRDGQRGSRRRPTCPAPSSRPPAPRRRRRSTRSRPIAEIARRHGIWLHVDAAMAGSAMILPECRWMWDGVEGADSLVLNPHKWLGAAVRLLALLRARSRAPGARDVHQPELPADPRSTSQVKNLRDWGIPLGRRFRALKLWFLIREQGVARLAERAAPRPRERALARRAGRRARRIGGCSRRFRCRPCACATSRRGSTAKRSTATRTRGPSASTARARPTSRRRCSTGAGWCGCPIGALGDGRGGRRRGLDGDAAGGGGVGRAFTPKRAHSAPNVEWRRTA